MYITEYGEITFEKPKSFDEKMREGASKDCGLAGAMKMREEHEKPWTLRKHKPTRCGHDEGY